MRISEELVRSGVFWIPGQDIKLSGTLRVQDGGRIELELVGLFFNEFKEVVESPEITRIVGEVEKEGLVTLDNCFYLNRNISFGGISKSRIFANSLYLGAQFDLDEPILVSTFCFSVEGLDEWLRISGISVQYSFEKRSATISYLSPDELTYELGSGMKLVITHVWSLPGSDILTSAVIKHKNYIRLESDQPIPVENFIQTAHRVNTFLCLAIDQNVSLMEVSVTSPEIVETISHDQTRRTKIQLYYQAHNYSEKLPKVEYFNMIFRFPQVREKFGTMLTAWFTAYEMVSPSLDLFFSTKNNAQRYLDGKFLALAQGLESYHRRTTQTTLMPKSDFDQLIETLLCACPKVNREWLSQKLQHANELSFAQRLENLLLAFEPALGDHQAIKRFIRAVVDTRNYLTHYDESLASRAVLGKGLRQLVLKMEAIFQMLLLVTMGFESTEVIEIVNSSDRFRSKLKDHQEIEGRTEN